MKKGADINLQNNRGKTALMIAISAEIMELCKLLVEKGADINLQDNDGKTALIQTVSYADTENMEFCKLLIEILIEKGADINLKNNLGETALSIAKKLNHKNIIKILLKLKPLEVFIKNQIIEFKKNKKSLNFNNIIKYFYDLLDYYNSFDSIEYYNLNYYNAERNKELNNLIKNIESTDNKSYLLNKKIRIIYKNEKGINAGGLSREFYDNLQTQINLKIKAKKELKSKNDLLEYKNQELDKKIKLKLENNKNNKLLKKEIEHLKNVTIKLLQEEIQDLNNDILKLNNIIDSSKEYDINQILKILAVSKLNYNPIYYINDTVKNSILIKISNLFDKKIEKNLIYNILDYISSNESNNFFKNEDFLLDYKKYINFAQDKDIYTNKDLKNFKNNYLKILLKNNNQKIIPKNSNLDVIEQNIKLKYLTNKNLKNNNLKEIEKNNNKNNNKNITDNITHNIIELIDIFIALGIYENIYDFFLSHFVEKNIDIDSFFNNLSFTFLKESNNENNIESNNKNQIEIEFKNLFKELTIKELYLFNKAISGSTYKLSKMYKINIILYDKNTKRLPMFHTCYNSMDIYYNEYFKNKYLNNKNEFVNLLNIAIGEGFNIA